MNGLSSALAEPRQSRETVSRSGLVWISPSDASPAHGRYQAPPKEQSHASEACLNMRGNRAIPVRQMPFPSWPVFLSSVKNLQPAQGFAHRRVKSSVQAIFRTAVNSLYPCMLYEPSDAVLHSSRRYCESTETQLINSDR